MDMGEGCIVYISSVKVKVSLTIPYSNYREIEKHGWFVFSSCHVLPKNAKSGICIKVLF